MATSTPDCHTTFPAIQFRSMLNKAHLNPSLHFFKLSQNPTETLPSLKHVCDEGSLNEAFKSLTNFLTHQNLPNLSIDRAYSPLLDLCAKKKPLSEGQQLHAHLIKSCVVWDSVFLSTKLVRMYVKSGSVFNAQKVFDKMSERTIFTWNAMIGAYASNGEPLKALELYKYRRVFGVSVDSFTFLSVLKACINRN